MDSEDVLRDTVQPWTLSGKGLRRRRWILGWMLQVRLETGGWWLGTDCWERWTHWNQAVEPWREHRSKYILILQGFTIRVKLLFQFRNHQFQSSFVFIQNNYGNNRSRYIKKLECNDKKNQWARRKWKTCCRPLKGWVPGNWNLLWFRRYISSL